MAVFRERFDTRSSLPHKACAQAIFQPSLRTTRTLLLPLIQGLPPDLCMAALHRKSDSTWDQLRQVRASYSDVELRAILMNSESKGLEALQAKSQESAMDTGHRMMREESEEMFFLQTPTFQDMPPTPRGDVDDDDDGEEDEEEEEEDVLPLYAWMPACLKDGWPPLEGHTWFYTVFFRVNGAKGIFQNVNLTKNRVLLRKLTRFREAHLAVVRALDQVYETHGSVRDELCAHVPSLYTPLGESHYAIDTKFATITTQRHKMKATPLEILEREYPDLTWRPEQAAQRIRDKSITDVSHHLDGGEWAPLGSAAPDVDTHTLFYGVTHVLNQCHLILERDFWAHERGGRVFDALWAYYASFVQLFEYCLQAHSPARMDDLYLMTPIGSTVSERTHTVLPSERVTPWELCSVYFDDGAYHAGDLPDLYHVLASIPLWGERRTPSYFLGKIYHKALPFACQRRHLIKRVFECVKQSDGFWRIFSRLAWVMLAGLYPGELGSFSTPYTGMRDLLRIKELTDHKTLLLDALSAGGSPASGGGPLVLFTVFAMHIVYMASKNAQYVEQAKRCIDWDNYKREVIHLCNIVRGNKLFSADPFKQARIQLNKTVKSPNTHVHRLRAASLEMMLSEQCKEHLEKKLLKDKQNHARDAVQLEAILRTGDNVHALFVQRTKLGAWAEEHVVDVQQFTLDHVREAYAVTQRAKSFYDSLLRETHFKGPIADALVRMPKSERMTLDAFSLLRLERYGGVSDDSVRLMCELVRIYYDKAAPRDFRLRLSQMLVKDFMVVCFYFNVAAHLSKIDFVPLDYETVQRTDEAMMARRHRLYPGEPVSESMYTVSIALCCDEICTLMGTGKHGSKKIAYDVEREQFVCVKNKKMRNKVKLGQENDEQEEEEEEDDDDDDADEADDGDFMHDPDYVSNVLQAQEDNDLDFDFAQLRTNNLIADASKGKGKRRTQVKQDAKEIRNERKAWSKFPCGQPVLQMSLRGRALVWGTALDKKFMYLFCPECGALHMYTMLNFCGSETGLYRCNECARKELMHTPYWSCAYCGQSSPGQINCDTHLPVLCVTKDPTNKHMRVEEHAMEIQQDLYFCKQHYRIARQFCWGDKVLPKDELWAMIRKVQAENMMRVAQGKYKRR